MGFFYLINIYYLSMENFATIAVAFITGVLGPIGVLYIKHVLDSRKKKPDMVMDTLRVSELINQKIAVLREIKIDNITDNIAKEYSTNVINAFIKNVKDYYENYYSQKEIIQLFKKYNLKNNKIKTTKVNKIAKKIAKIKTTKENKIKSKKPLFKNFFITDCIEPFSNQFLFDQTKN